MLGFVLRTSKNFKLCSTTLLLFNAYVRSILEYASTVCNPQYEVKIDAIEKIQNKVRKHLHFKCLYKNQPLPNIPSLQDRRIERDQVYLFKILRNFVDAPFLLENIYLRCPRTSPRSPCLYKYNIPFTKTKYWGILLPSDLVRCITDTS
jgi:hypothetical protein